MEARLLSDGDTRAYLSLRVHAAREDHRLTPELRFELMAFAKDASNVISDYLSGGTHVWGLYDRLALAGVVAVSQRGSDASSLLWLWGLHVREAYRGTPVSRALMEAALTWCEDEPADQRLFAAYHQSNYRARQFLHRWHFNAPGDNCDLVRSTVASSEYVLVERERARGVGTDV